MSRKIVDLFLLSWVVLNVVCLPVLALDTEATLVQSTEQIKTNGAWAVTAATGGALAAELTELPLQAAQAGQMLVGSNTEVFAAAIAVIWYIGIGFIAYTAYSYGQFLGMTKKASLQLSVNAIVVLVLAITMLGLGLAFTKGKFAELGERIEVPEPNYPATAEDPIVLAVNEITMKQGKAAGFSANFYNDGNTGYFYPCLQCNNTWSDDNSTLRQAVEVTSGEYETYRVIVNEPGDDPTTQWPPVGTWICTLQFIDAGNSNPGGTDPLTCEDSELETQDRTPGPSKQIVLKVV